MTIDTARLRELATAATPGPWTESGRDVDHDRMVAEGRNPGDACGLGCEVEGPPEAWLRGQFHAHADAAYIAALDPQTVLALLDRIEALEGQVRILLSNIDDIYEAESIADEDWALIHEDMAVARAALGDVA